MSLNGTYHAQQPALPLKQGQGAIAIRLLIVDRSTIVGAVDEQGAGVVRAGPLTASRKLSK